MKEDVGMSKPEKHANKVRWDPKLNKPLPYNLPCVLKLTCIYYQRFQLITCHFFPCLPT